MRVSRRHVLRALAASGVAAGAGLATYGALDERHRATLTRATAPVNHLPRALAGLRIGLLSDIHFGAFTPSAIVPTAVDMLLAERPDLILLAGDYVLWRDRGSVAPCAQALSRLAAPLGVFAVTGNHDPEPAVEAAFEARGIRVLRDERVELTARGEQIALGGLQYWSKRMRDLERLFRGAEGFRVLLAHDPRRLTEASRLGIPLVLSGHTHGGQIVLPLIGAPAAAGYPVVSGIGRRGNTTVFVSRGLGTTAVPLRLNCPPEVAVVTLERLAARG